MTDTTSQTRAEPKRTPRRKLVEFYAEHPDEFIVCQRCLAGSAESLEAGQGCRMCGGYRCVYIRSKAVCCGQRYWTRPGMFTAYAGKPYTSIDGVDLRWDPELGNVCEACYKGPR